MSYTFNIVVHGTVAILANYRMQSLEIMMPYDDCHCFMAACLDEGAKPQWYVELARKQYTIKNVSPGKSPQFTVGDSSRLVIDIPLIGSNAYCMITSLPWPDDIIPWRSFPPQILSLNSNTYQHNHLDIVDQVGIPTTYVVQYLNQNGNPPMITDGAAFEKSITPTSGSVSANVARLHLFAESPTDADHNAVATLNGCAWPALDIAISSSAADTPASRTAPPANCGLGYNEQFALNENEGLTCMNEPPCFSGVEESGLDPVDAKRFGILGRPRTCIPLIGIRG